MTREQIGLVSGVRWYHWIPVIIALATALVGYGALRSDVVSLHEQVTTKADRATVETEYLDIVRELQGINNRLDHMEGRR